MPFINSLVNFSDVIYKTLASGLLSGFVLFIVYCFMDKRFDTVSINIQPRGDESNNDNSFHYSDFCKVMHNTGFWMIAIICVFYYASIRTFMNFATDFMVNSFAVDKETAGWVISTIPYSVLFSEYSTIG